MRRVLGRLWWGQYPLPVAFWGFFVGLGLLVIVLLAFAFAFVSVEFSIRPLALLVVLSLGWAYGLVACVGVWRSASTGKSHQVYQVMAKGLIVLLIGRMVWGLANGGGLRLLDALTAGLN